MTLGLHDAHHGYMKLRIFFRFCYFSLLTVHQKDGCKIHTQLSSTSTCKTIEVNHSIHYPTNSSFQKSSLLRHLHASQFPHPKSFVFATIVLLFFAKSSNLLNLSFKGIPFNLGYIQNRVEYASHILQSILSCNHPPSTKLTPSLMFFKFIDQTDPNVTPKHNRPLLTILSTQNPIPKIFLPQLESSNNIHQVRLN